MLEDYIALPQGHFPTPFLLSLQMKRLSIVYAVPVRHMGGGTPSFQAGQGRMKGFSSGRQEEGTSDDITHFLPLLSHLLTGFPIPPSHNNNNTGLLIKIQKHGEQTETGEKPDRDWMDMV